MKYKHGTAEYWKDWYWNRGGREKVQEKRYIAEYNRTRKQKNVIFATMNETNWVSQSASPTVTESDRRGLEKAHRYEKAMLKNGYRWYTINSRTKILVECDKDGNPTQRGKQQIKRAQENCGTMK